MSHDISDATELTNSQTEESTNGRADERTRASTASDASEVSSSRGGASRRDVLKSTAAGAGLLAAGGLGASSVIGQSDVQQIPTPWLHVDGNEVLDPLGEPVKLRGLNMADPKRIDVTAPARGKTALQVVDLLTDPDAGWHPRVIRVPAQPVDIGEHEPGASGGPPQPVAFTQAELEEYLEEYYDPIVERCRERGVYCIVDFHRHWQDADAAWESEDTNYWAHPDTLEPNEDLQEEVDMFWDTVAPRYAEMSHVIFELYNEPTQPGMWTSIDNDADVWRAWKETAQPWVDTIREHAPHNLILIGSPSWTQSPEGYYVEPFDGENLAYTYHIYPGHNASAQQDWDAAAIDSNGEGMAGVHEEVPVFVTEFGWQNDIRDRVLGGTTEDFGVPFMEFMEERDGIHWTAWCADPIWRPVMFNRPFAPVDHTDEEDAINHPYEDEIPVYCEDLPCEWSLLGRDEGDPNDFKGAFIQDTLEELKDDRIPTVEFDDQPPAVPDPTVVDVTQTTMTLEWDAVDSPGDSPFSHYNVYLDGDLRTTVPAGTTSVEIEDLLAGKEFEVAVSAEDGTGNESAPATLTVTTDPFDDDQAPPTPEGLAATSTTHLEVDVEWDGVEDEGPAGMHHYKVYVDGEVDHTVRADETSTTLTELTPDTTYQIAVSAVDFAQNESAPSDALSVTTEVDRPRPGDLLVDNFDGDPEWPENELGRQTGTGGFESIGTTDDDRLRIEYDGGGWFGSPVATDVTSYDALYLRLVGDGGDNEAIELSFGPVEGQLGTVGEGSIEQRPSLVRVDLPEDGDGLEDPGELRLGFAAAGSGAVELDALWLRQHAEDDVVDELAPPTDLSSPEQEETTVDLAWSGVDGAEAYEITVSGVYRTTVEGTSATVEDLSPDSQYTFGVRAVTGDETSELTTVQASTGGEAGTDDPCEEVGAEAGEELNNGDWVCDLNGDGNYRDVTASGDTTIQDLQHFFANQHRDPYDSRTDLFDYTGNGDVGQPDVVDLFHEI